jgi:hypothetical protein
MGMAVQVPLGTTVPIQQYTPADQQSRETDVVFDQEQQRLSRRRGKIGVGEERVASREASGIPRIDEVE